MKVGFIGLGLYVLPALALLYIVNRILTNSNLFSYVPVRDTKRQYFSDCDNSTFGENRTGMFRPYLSGWDRYSTPLKTIKHIITPSHVLKVLNRVISSIAVLMVNVVTLWSWADKGFRYKLVNHWPSKLTSTPKRQSHSPITLIGKVWFEYVSDLCARGYFISPYLAISRYGVCGVRGDCFIKIIHRRIIT